ncbi:MAG: hypothetical protein L0Z73_11520 [Gammaproteobacteria bacterium]|nr:hypothetical protein [Gammaproteobacteria bacterium]
MESANSDLIKHREILFMSPQREKDPAAAALALLNGIDGILSVTRTHAYGIHISYQLTRITLNEIEDALQEIGFHLDNSILSKLKRALFYYAEDTQLANLGYDHAESKSTLEIFINRYNQLPHGCRDERPTHFRHYS